MILISHNCHLSHDLILISHDCHPERSEGPAFTEARPAVEAHDFSRANYPSPLTVERARPELIVA
jgi:hypothetical protein